MRQGCPGERPGAGTTAGGHAVLGAARMVTWTPGHARTARGSPRAVTAEESLRGVHESGERGDAGGEVGVGADQPHLVGRAPPAARHGSRPRCRSRRARRPCEGGLGAEPRRGPAGQARERCLARRARAVRSGTAGAVGHRRIGRVRHRPVRTDDPGHGGRRLAAPAAQARVCPGGRWSAASRRTRTARPAARSRRRRDTGVGHGRLQDVPAPPLALG